MHWLAGKRPMPWPPGKQGVPIACLTSCGPPSPHSITSLCSPPGQRRNAGPGAAARGIFASFQALHRHQRHGLGDLSATESPRPRLPAARGALASLTLDSPDQRSRTSSGLGYPRRRGEALRHDRGAPLANRSQLRQWRLLARHCPTRLRRRSRVHIVVKAPGRSSLARACQARRPQGRLRSLPMIPNEAGRAVGSASMRNQVASAAAGPRPELPITAASLSVRHPREHTSWQCAAAHI